MRPRLSPAVAACRDAVRQALVDLPHGSTVLVACSGGADSLALAAAAAFVAPKLGIRAGAVVVDHGLQPGSDTVAAQAAEQCKSLGLDPVSVTKVAVGTEGGPEAAARRARYAAFEKETEADVVLLGHTRDDQAETVLLGLARGSGARSLSGMAPVSGRLRRPFLNLDRETTVKACEAQHIEPWADPQNTDSAYARVRVRREVLPVLERALGPGIAEALARTADLLRADADALDGLADDAFASLVREDLTVDVAGLAALPEAIRSRVVRRTAIAAGCKATDLTAGHVAAVGALVTDWHGQRWIDLPQSVRAVRRAGVIAFGTDVAP